MECSVRSVGTTREEEEDDEKAVRGRMQNMDIFGQNELKASCKDTSDF
jgi:hypothetical protein